MARIAAVVVLYKPELDMLDNLNTYIDQVEKVYAIDNSEQVNTSFVNKILTVYKVEYISNETNLGIATALNIGARKAIEEKFDYLLTMDQDSEASPSMVTNLLKCFSQDPKAAIVSPIVQHRVGRKENFLAKNYCNQTLSVWTSGNLIDLKIFQLTGGYKEDFFIDYVDHDFCLRLNYLGYKIFLCYQTAIKHNLGKIKEVDLLFRKVYPTNHSPLRLYYRTRNRFYLKKIYKHIIPDFFKQDDKEFWKTFLKAILFEKGKLKKIQYFILGFIDYKKNKLGKFNRV